MAADEEASSSVPSLGRLGLLLSGMSRKSIHYSDTRNNSPSLLCTDDDDESNDNNYTAAEMERKSEDIQRCLSGKSVGDANADESVVDLWHLRALSLSNGGLLNSTLRKRCWPKLLGLDETVFLNSSASAASLMANSGNIRSLAASTLAIQSALAKVSKTSSSAGLLWDVEGQIKSNRRAREAERAMTLRSRLRGGTVGNINDTDIASVASTAASVASNASSIAAMYQQQSKGKKMTKQELSILTNILTAVSKQTPFDHKTADPSLVIQLANLSALLLINLESPSLTSIMMQSLAKGHLHVCDTAVEEMIESTFWTLLDCADEKYGCALRDVAGDNNNENAFASAWVSSWFTAALPTGLGRADSTAASHSNSLASIELEVASRFIDVFLCSHPNMPTYVSVALVMHPANRAIIDEADNPTDVLANLPSVMVASILGITDEVFFDGSDGGNIIIADEPKANLMEVVEDIVSGAIDLMRAVPPSKFIDIATHLPVYMLKSTAPTDFALIQKAKHARSTQTTAVDSPLASLSPLSEASTPTASPTNGDLKASKFDFAYKVHDTTCAVDVPTDEKYALAVTAVGMNQPARPNVLSIKTWSAYMAVYLAGLVLAIASDRAIVKIMSDAHRPETTVSSPVPAVIPKAKASTPAPRSNSLIPTSEVYDGIPKPFSSVVVSSLSLQTVDKVFVHGASYIGATVGPVFGPIFAEEAIVDLDCDDIGMNATHRFRAIENLILGAMPTTYYYS